MNTLYTIGYTGRSLDELAGFALQHGAGVVDIRFSAWSRDPKWRKESLQKSMEYRGVDYIHIRELGNLNYNLPKPIEIASPDKGCEALGYLLGLKPQIILCACSEPEGCHRNVVAVLMRDRDGVEAVHLGGKPPLAEPTGLQGELF